MNFSKIDQQQNHDFNVCWDLGRRCTYACTYCGPHHSNKTSPLVNFDALAHTLDGVVEYADLLNQYRTEAKVLDLAFTGGEPTIHPDFFKFLVYCKERYPFIKTNITTNGCYSQSKNQLVMDTVDSATVSYHLEASSQEKKLVLDNIKTMADCGYNVRVNHMYHKQYWAECIETADLFDSWGVTYTPRPIGDANNASDIADGTAHVYTKSELAYFKNFWSRGKNAAVKPKAKPPPGVMHMVADKPPEKMAVTSIGRPCCNGKCMNITVDGVTKGQTFVPSTNFQGWNCMVNWDFLFVNSELDGVWHHQTCQVNLEGQVGPIGKASEFNKINAKLKQTLLTGKMPVIKCPKTHCGCGLCSPKALYQTDAQDIFDRRNKNLIPVFQEDIKDISNDTSIYRRLTRP